MCLSLRLRQGMGPGLPGPLKDRRQQEWEGLLLKVMEGMTAGWFQGSITGLASFLLNTHVHTQNKNEMEDVFSQKKKSVGN